MNSYFGTASLLKYVGSDVNALVSFQSQTLVHKIIRYTILCHALICFNFITIAFKCNLIKLNNDPKDKLIKVFFMLLGFLYVFLSN